MEISKVKRRIEVVSEMDNISSVHEITSFCDCLIGSTQIACT